jgi:penicillin-binding protein 1A
MSDANEPQPTPVPGDAGAPGGPRPRTKIKRLRLLALLIPVAALAGVSTVFGMMMAVASDLPALEQLPQVAKRKNSILYDVRGRRLATLTSDQGRIIVTSDQISRNVKNAVIAIEDERFWENPGVDFRGIARALVQDIIQRRAVQGGSTITQQFVKNALKAQNERTLLAKMREAALAFHMTRKWSKERILTEYLNSVYFGNGAYGIESAARTYFGADPNHSGCGRQGRPMCASELNPAESAMLAAIIASPSAFDPVAHPRAARARRDLVLRKMLEQGYIDERQYEESLQEPTHYKVTPPRLETPANSEYFVSWVRQLLIEEVGPQRAFEGNLRVTTTLDLDLQRAAEQAVNNHLSWPQGPTASMVVIDNHTGEVRAMVGGRDYQAKPFNLATQSRRQPGSAFKPFILAEALRRGISPGAVFPSRRREFKVPGGGGEVFVVNNFENRYSGQISLAGALTHSDNSVFAALGIQLGTKRIARLAQRMGIRTPVSANYAMTLGGLKEGVTPLDMAHAYTTFAAHGRRITGTLAAPNNGPVGLVRIRRVGEDDKQRLVKENKRRAIPVLPRHVADTATNLLTGPVKYGTATRAQYGGFAAGKTGTTENSGDAWFVGFTDRWTIAVWVGYPDTLKPMLTEFRGDDVTGGTFPALIWRDFVIAANKIIENRKNREREAKGLPPITQTTTVPKTADPATPTPTTSTPSEAPSAGDGGGTDGTGGSSGGGTGGTGTGRTPGPTAPQQPSTPAPAAPQPQPQAAPPGGGGGGGNTGGTGAPG